MFPLLLLIYVNRGRQGQHVFSPHVAFQCLFGYSVSGTVGGDMSLSASCSNVCFGRERLQTHRFWQFLVTF